MDLFVKCNLAVQNRAASFYCKKSILTMFVLQLFVDEGVIAGFELSKFNSNEVHIILRYVDNKCIIKRLEREDRPIVNFGNGNDGLSWDCLYVITTGEGGLLLLNAKNTRSLYKWSRMGGHIICKVVLSFTD